MKIYKRDSFKDPIYGWITVDVSDIKVFNSSEAEKIKECIQKIISSEYFNRLRDIKQLGTLQEIFPSATHSRFSHSLGVFHLAKLALKNQNGFQWKKAEAVLLLFGALLHDIGHGFFSHGFELFATTEKTKFSHENMTAKIIKSNKMKKIFHESGIELLKKVQIDLSELFMDKNKSNRKFIKVESILSSQLDIDRLDYLARDAYHCGVHYRFGEGELLLNGAKWNDDEKKVVFNREHKWAIAHYLFTRFQMHTSIYKHKESIFKAELLCFIGDVLREEKNTTELGELSRNFNRIAINKFMKYTDSWVIQSLKSLQGNSQNKGNLKDLIMLFFDLNCDFEIVETGNDLEKYFNNKKVSSELKRDKSENILKGSTSDTKGHYYWIPIKEADIYNNEDNKAIYISDAGNDIEKFDLQIMGLSKKDIATRYMLWKI